MHRGLSRPTRNITPTTAMTQRQRARRTSSVRSAEDAIASPPRERERERETPPPAGLWVPGRGPGPPPDLLDPLDSTFWAAPSARARLRRFILHWPGKGEPQKGKTEKVTSRSLKCHLQVALIDDWIPFSGPVIFGGTQILVAQTLVMKMLISKY